MEYISEILSFIVGAFAGGVTVKIHNTRKIDRSLSLSNITAGGDVAGRDITK